MAGDQIASDARVDSLLRHAPRAYRLLPKSRSDVASEFDKKRGKCSSYLFLNTVGYTHT